jgi:hypothetical protein
MPSLTRRSRNFTVSFFTSIVLLALLLFYILEHIPNNEKRINARNFRVLARMGVNLTTTIQSYHHNVVPTFARFTLAHLQADQGNSGVNRGGGKGENGKPTSQRDLSKIIESSISGEKLQSRFRLEYDAEQDADLGLFHLKDRHLHFFVKVNSEQLTQRWKLPNDGSFLFQAKLAIDSLLPPLHRKDIFEHLLVFQTKKEKVKEEEKVKGSLLYTSSPFYPSLVHIDSLVHSRSGLFGGKVMDMELAGEPYKLYLLGQEVGLEEKWVLAGAVPLKHFRTELLAIDKSLVVFILLALALLVLALPFIKLLLMNEQERLQKQDVILTSLALFVGVSLTVLLLFDTYVYFGPDALTKRTQLESLANKVAQELNEEILQAKEQLTALDDLPPKRENIIYLNNKTQGKWEKPEVKDSLPVLTIYPDLIRVLWADTTGQRLCTWTTKGENHENASVANREYFRAINDGKGWIDSLTKEPFFLQSILSWIDGEKYAIISKKSRNHPGSLTPDSITKASVIALTTKLTSLTKPSLPLGYGFFVINQEGEVLFHKNENLNLNENLLEESGSNPSLQAALFGFTPTHFEEHYQGSLHQLFVQPLPKLPLFLVTYVDHDYQSAAKVNIVSLATSLLLIYFLMHALLVGLPLLTTASPSKLKYNRLSFQWLWPRKNDQQTEAYWRVAAALFYAMVVITWFTKREMPVASFFIMLLTISFTFLFAYITIRNTKLTNLPQEKARWVLLTAAAMVFLLNVICSFMYGNYGRVFFFQVILTGGLVALYLLPGSMLRLRVNREYQYAHIAMVLGWLILTSALPSFFVFRIAYDYEAELMVRYHQLHLAQEISQKSHRLKQLPEEGINYQAGNINRSGGRLYSEFFHRTLAGPEAQALDSLFAPPAPEQVVRVRKASLFSAGSQSDQEGTGQREKGSDKRLLYQFIQAVRPVFNNVLASEAFLMTPPSNRATWTRIPLPQKELLEMTYKNRAYPKDSVYLVSELPLYRLPSFTFAGDTAEQVLLSGGFFWVEVLLLVLFLFFMVRFLINRLFNLSLLNNLKMGKVDRGLLDDELKNKVLLISLPGAPDLRKNDRSNGHSSSVTNQEVLLPPLKPTEIDLILQERSTHFTPLKIGEEEKVILVKNFDHEPYEEKWIQLKLDLLHALDELNGKKIILSSAEHPTKWEENAKAALQAAGKDKEAAAKQERVLHLIQLLLHRLQGYTKVYQPLQGLQQKKQPLSKKAKTMDQRDLLLQTVEQECSSCLHLAQYKQQLEQYVRVNHEKKKLTSVDLILKIQSLAHLYYRALWSSCSEVEHYMLFDLAQDGLVNARNVGVLSSLLSKGLLIREENLTLRLFNQSFRNFVLTVVDKEEALRYEKDAAQGSSWETYRTPLLMVLAGAMLFIFYTQKDTWTMMLAVLTAFSTMVGILPRLGFLLPAFLSRGEGK